MRGLGGTYHNRSQRGSAECSSAESADEHRPKGVFGFAWALVMEVCSTVVNLLLGLRAMVGNVFYFFGGNRSFMRCQMGMEQAKTFEEWYQHAMEYCNYYGYYEWRLCTTDGLFNYAEIRHRTRGLRTLLAELEEADANRKPPSPGNRSFSKEEAAASDEVVRERFEHLLSHLRSDLIRGPCAINRPGAFTFSIGTKRVIEQYVQEIQRALTIVAHFDSVDLLSRYRYLNECLRNHGKTALLLSGGQSMSAYHLGVCRFLHSMRFLPRVICGAGAAAVVAAFVCCHTDAELNDKLDPSSGKLSFTAFLAKSRQGGFMARCARRMRRFCETGTLMDINVVADFVGGVLGDITFKEAYEKTGRVLNVVVSNLRECMTTLPQTHYTIPQPLLGSGETKWVANHLTAPDVLVRTAAVAAVSSGLFGSWLWKGYGLLRKNPTTGATESFAPCAYSGTTGQTAEAVAIDRLSEQFNVTCIIRARNKFRLFSNGAAAPVSPAFRASSLSRFVTRLETELKHEACYRLQTMLEFFRTLPYIGQASRKLLSMDAFLRDVDVDVELTSHQGAVFNLLEHPSKSFLAMALTEGEKSTWPRLACIQLHLAVESTFDDLLSRMLQNIRFTSDHLIFSDFPFPQVLDAQPCGRFRIATTAPFPFPDTDDTSSMGEPPCFEETSRDTAGGFGSAMIIRHVTLRRSPSAGLSESPMRLESTRSWGKA